MILELPDDLFLGNQTPQQEQGSPLCRLELTLQPRTFSSEVDFHFSMTRSDSTDYFKEIIEKDPRSHLLDGITSLEEDRYRGLSQKCIDNNLE